MKAKKGEAESILVDVPEFRSEAEEAEWWDRHQDLIADLLVKHGASLPVRVPRMTIQPAHRSANLGYRRHRVPVQSSKPACPVRSHPGPS